MCCLMWLIGLCLAGLSMTAPSAWSQRTAEPAFDIEPTDWGRVTGGVFDAQSGSPIPRGVVEVQVDGQFGNRRSTGRTDGIGSYTCSAPVGRVSSKLNIVEATSGTVLETAIGLFSGRGRTKTKRLDVAQLVLHAKTPGYHEFEGTVPCVRYDVEQMTVSMAPILLTPEGSPEAPVTAPGWQPVRVLAIEVAPARVRPGGRVAVTARTQWAMLPKGARFSMRCEMECLKKPIKLSLRRGGVGEPVALVGTGTVRRNIDGTFQGNVVTDAWPFPGTEPPDTVTVSLEVVKDAAEAGPASLTHTPAQGDLAVALGQLQKTWRWGGVPITTAAPDTGLLLQLAASVRPVPGDLRAFGMLHRAALSVYDDARRREKAGGDAQGAYERVRDLLANALRCARAGGDQQGGDTRTGQVYLPGGVYAPVSYTTGVLQTVAGFYVPHGTIDFGVRESLRVLAGNPQDRTAYCNLAASFIALGEPELARDALATCRQLQPDGAALAQVTYLEGVLARMTGDTLQASKLLTEAVALAPRHPRANLALAVLHAENKDTDAALACLRAHIQSFSTASLAEVHLHSQPLDGVGPLPDPGSAAGAGSQTPEAPAVLEFGEAVVVFDLNALGGGADAPIDANKDRGKIEGMIRSARAGGALRYRPGAPGRYTVTIRGGYDARRGGTIEVIAEISGAGPNGPISVSETQFGSLPGADALGNSTTTGSISYTLTVSAAMRAAEAKLRAALGR
ncbi:MAG: hypothetical protein HY321_17570 [Armatimonadetes bacterium]|nr:hypothetical protein [Armatimonadota bacterium]